MAGFIEREDMTARERAERVVMIWMEGVEEGHSNSSRLTALVEYEISDATKRAHDEASPTLVLVDNEETVKERDELRKELTCLESRYKVLSRDREKLYDKLAGIRNIVTSS